MHRACYAKRSGQERKKVPPFFHSGSERLKNIFQNGELYDTGFAYICHLKHDPFSRVSAIAGVIAPKNIRLYSNSKRPIDVGWILWHQCI